MSLPANATPAFPDFPALVLFLLGWFLVAYLSVFLHELGHALLGYWSGFRISSFGVGTGGFIWVGGWRGTRIYLGLHGKLALTIYVMPQIYPTRRQLAMTFSGGIWAHVLLFLTGLWLWQNVSWGGPVWLALVIVNGIAVVYNAIPIKVRFGGALMRNDGWSILEVLRHGMREPDPTGQVNTLRVLQPLLTAIKDVRGHYTSLQAGAAAWSSLGNADRGRQLLAEAAELPLNPAPFDLAFGALVRGLTARAAGDLPAATEALDEAERSFAQQANEAGLFVTSWGRAMVLAYQGNVPEALQRLEALAAHPIALARSPLAVALLADRLRALAESHEGVGLEAALKEYETLTKLHPSAVRDLQVYKTLAVAKRKAGQAEVAGRACAQALEAARQVDRSLGHEEDRALFRQGQEDLLQLARALAGHLGVGARNAESVWCTAAELQAEAASLLERRSRRLARIGWLVMAISFAVSAVRLAPVLLSPQRPLRTVAEAMAIMGQHLPSVLLLGGTVFAAAGSASWWLLGRALPSLRRHGGVVTCFLAALPYVMLLEWWVGWLTP